MVSELTIAANSSENAPSPQLGCKFFSMLPGEIRNKIYEYALYVPPNKDGHVVISNSGIKQDSEQVVQRGHLFHRWSNGSDSEDDDDGNDDSGDDRHSEDNGLSEDDDLSRPNSEPASDSDSEEERPSVLSLLQTCRLANNEASGIFYFQHHIELDLKITPNQFALLKNVKNRGHIFDFLDTLSTARLSNFRCLTLNVVSLPEAAAACRALAKYKPEKLERIEFKMTEMSIHWRLARGHWNDMGALEKAVKGLQGAKGNEKKKTKEDRRKEKEEKRKEKGGLVKQLGEEEEKERPEISWAVLQKHEGNWVEIQDSRRCPGRGRRM